MPEPAIGCPIGGERGTNARAASTDRRSGSVVVEAGRRDRCRSSEHGFVPAIKDGPHVTSTSGHSLFRRALRWIVYAAVAALAVVVGLEIVLGPRVAVITPERGEVIRTIVASGRVLAPYRVDIGAQVTGVVAEIPVAEGQTVDRGTVLIRLDDREVTANVGLAEAALAQAGAKLKQIEDVALPVARQSVAQTEANLVAAQAAFTRVERLKQTGFATQAQVDDARKARDVAVAQSRAAHLQLQSNLPGGSDRVDRKSTRLNSSHNSESRMPSSA
jgi:HlyD family secretion protein